MFIGMFGWGLLLTGLFVNTLRQGMDILAVLPIAFFAVFLTVTWRGIFVGVYVSETGIRIRTVGRTVTMPWHEVAGFEVLPVPEKATEAIWVVGRHGPSVLTPIMAYGRWYGRIHGWGSLRRVPREDLDATINTFGGGTPTPILNSWPADSPGRDPGGPDWWAATRLAGGGGTGATGWGHRALVKLAVSR
jgi:hypothetical protein